MKNMTNEMREGLERIVATRTADDFLKVREEMDRLGFEPNTVILQSDWNLLCMVRALMYNPADYGRFGKIGEFEHRVDLWCEGGRTWAFYREFVARKSGQRDAADGEHKTGAGDWLYSRRYDTYEEILAEYAKKETGIVWRTEYFDIRCRWCDLFEYLAGYKGKGDVTTWFNRSLKYGDGQVIVKLQTWTTSQKKIAFLQACPYNID